MSVDLSAVLVDKKLVNAASIELDSNGDMLVVLDNDNILQSAYNRCVSILGTRWYDRNGYGSELGYYVQNNSPYQLTKDVAKGYIQQALAPLIGDGRVTKLVSVDILSTTAQAVYVQVVVTIGTQRGVLVFDVPTF